MITFFQASEDGTMSIHYIQVVKYYYDAALELYLARVNRGFLYGMFSKDKIYAQRMIQIFFSGMTRIYLSTQDLMRIGSG